MKKILAAVLCMIMALSCLTAFAEAKTGYEKVAEHMIEFHYFFNSQSEQDEYDTAEICPLLELYDHSYGVAAYSTESRLFDVLFVPDETGLCVSEVHIIAYRSDMESVENAELMAFAHIIGLLYPYVLELSNSGGSDAFVDAMVYGMMEALTQPVNADWEADGADYGGVCQVIPYVLGDTFGICIQFYEPLSFEALSQKDMLMGQ